MANKTNVSVKQMAKYDCSSLSDLHTYENAGACVITSAYTYHYILTFLVLHNQNGNNIQRL